MTKRTQNRTALVLLVAAIALPASAQAVGVPDAGDVAAFLEGCFLDAPLAGAQSADQYCIKVPAGTPLEDVLRTAPKPYSDWNAADTITLGTDWEGLSKSGQTFQWWASSGCSSGNWIGNYPSDWVNRVSSAEISPSVGCNWFNHFDLNNQAGEYIECGLTVQYCNGIRMNTYGMSDRSNSMRFTS